MRSGQRTPTVATCRLREARRTYTGFVADLRARTGHSLLHDLADNELEQLIAHLLAPVPDHALTERGPWTLCPDGQPVQ